MRNEAEVFGQLLAFAEQDPRIKVVLLNGSRVNPNVTQDALCDYDVIYGVTDIAPYAQDQRWIARFGELMIMQHNRIEEDDEPWDIFLMQFNDGIRIDLSFRKVEHIVEPADSLTKVLLDKDNRMGNVEPPSDASYVTSKPDRRQYDQAVNEIWWCSTNVAKGLWRKELPYAKFMLDVVVRDALIKLLTWYVGMNSGWSANTGKAGRWLERFLPEELWSAYVRTYADSDLEHIWDALIATGELTRTVGVAVAEQLGYDYPHEDDRGVSRYINRLRAECER
ncbi:aminoglycoside 6-adenylyltransferase [Cohnella cholangitidis]|uniref:Aminoglycoside 6-adenylyltransferase n=1 Tax=Cohnella cholangitidis TaxID=2598458 RepID=A0A7G5BZY2_9BACL|nr:aminoglycoside 6-adenylyltransferase [Cohnella cholangitidis]QMV42516.1 aminoglycoside 6-adenylyltransferase [Cohnella cholangitidis]